jgi:hypothetical protein
MSQPFTSRARYVGKGKILHEVFNADGTVVGTRVERHKILAAVIAKDARRPSKLPVVISWHWHLDTRPKPGPHQEIVGAVSFDHSKIPHIIKHLC